jgi:hypothetical protein
MKERKIYLTNGDVEYIYDDLLSQGLFEYYITIKIIDEVQIDYTFLSKLTWRDFIEGDSIVDLTGAKDKEYFVNDHVKEEVLKAMDAMLVEDPDEKIVRSPIRELFKHLTTYERIKNFKQHSLFRVDHFREHTVDINGVKTYMLRTIEDKEEYDPEDKNISKCFLYIAVFADRMEKNRPEGFKTVISYDKKIGISKEIENRMNDLSNDKKHGGTLSPIYVKALRAWVMPTKLCRQVERELHRFYEERNTGGEWFSDYYDDIIKTVEKKLRKLVKEGNPIVKVNITEENEDVTYTYKLNKSFVEQNVPDDTFIPRLKYEL